MNPDNNLLALEFWGSGNEIAAGLAGGSNISIGSNPPWSAADFLSFYPKFGGLSTAPPLTLQGTLSAGSPVVGEIGSTAGIVPGQLAAGPGLPTGCTVVSVDSDTQITLSGSVTSDGQSTLTVYVAPLVPLAVLNAYISLASASLVQARWRDAWPIAMGLFVAHFATLWLRSDGDSYSTPGQAAAAGLKQGITVSAAAGGVSQGTQPVTGLDTWAAWNQTQYGVQFASFAKVIGAGPMLVW
jgi:hypothetical protein